MPVNDPSQTILDDLKIRILKGITRDQHRILSRVDVDYGSGSIVVVFCDFSIDDTGEQSLKINAHTSGKENTGDRMNTLP